MRVLLFLLALLTANNAQALPCGNRLVEPGASKFDVLERCGEPNWIDNHTAFRGTRLGADTPLEIDQLEEVKIEEWVYNFGPTRLMEYLEFENGVLKQLHNLRQGY